MCGYLISSPLGQNANLREMLEGFAEMRQTDLVGIVTDECETSLDIFLGRSS